jgi:hypothetical protein
MRREAHVAAGVDEDHQQQEGRHEDHQRVGRIDLKADHQLAGAGGDREELAVERVLAKMRRRKNGERNRPSQRKTDKCPSDCRQRAHRLVAIQKQEDRHKGQEGRHWQQPREI